MELKKLDTHNWVKVFLFFRFQESRQSIGFENPKEKESRIKTTKIFEFIFCINGVFPTNMIMSKTSFSMDIIEFVA